VTGPIPPHFGTVEYWEGETRDLEEQLEVIRREDETGPAMAEVADLPAESGPEEPLSNSDYFWDWDSD